MRPTPTVLASVALAWAVSASGIAAYAVADPPPGARGQQGEQGPSGDVGPQGDIGQQGDTGPPGPSGADAPRNSSFSYYLGPPNEVCPHGDLGYVDVVSSIGNDFFTGKPRIDNYRLPKCAFP